MAVLSLIGCASGGKATNWKRENYLAEATKLANKGDTSAQIELGSFYRNEKNWVEAIKWNLIASVGETQGWCGNDSVYMRFENVSKSDFALGKKLALQWVVDAANRGDAKFEFALGKLYEEGPSPYTEFDMPKDISKAAKMFRSALIKNYEGAAYELGKLAKLSDGHVINYTAAAVLFRRAAADGAVQARCPLGEMYLAGRGVSQNVEEAYYWLQSGKRGLDAIKATSFGVAQTDYELCEIELKKVDKLLSSKRKILLDKRILLEDGARYSLPMLFDENVAKDIANMI